MKLVKKLLFVSTFTLLVVLLYRVLLPVQVVAVYQDKNFTDILVKNFPLSEYGKREWWKKNRDEMQNKFNFPKKDNEGRYIITIWSFDGVYKKIPDNDNRLSTETSDLLCFTSLKEDANCIDKNRLMTIQKNLNGPESIRVR
ncbi:DUF943 family protein [Erwinia mallotivora]|uniref:DUF943 family protein n=1 Tax=Erwinia mallotivora TaxID=69222 RepID=UPI0035F0F281